LRHVLEARRPAVLDAVLTGVRVLAVGLLSATPEDASKVAGVRVSADSGGD
jgi:hypothetical protein